MYMIGDWSLTLSPRKPSLKPKITFFFFLKKAAPFTFRTTDLKPIFLADRPTCSAVASAAYRESRDRPFLSSKQPAEAPVFLLPLASVTVTKVLFLFSKTWTKSLFFCEYCSRSLRIREAANGKRPPRLTGLSAPALSDLYVKSQNYTQWAISTTWNRQIYMYMGIQVAYLHCPSIMWVNKVAELWIRTWILAPKIGSS